MSLIPSTLDEHLENLFSGTVCNLVFSCDCGQILKAKIIDSLFVLNRNELDILLEELSLQGLRGNVSMSRIDDSESVLVKVESFLDIPKHKVGINSKKPIKGRITPSTTEQI